MIYLLVYWLLCFAVVLYAYHEHRSLDIHKVLALLIYAGVIVPWAFWVILIEGE